MEGKGQRAPAQVAAADISAGCSSGQQRKLQQRAQAQVAAAASSAGVAAAGSSAGCSSSQQRRGCSSGQLCSPFSLCSSTVAPPPLNAYLFTLLLICWGVSLQAGGCRWERGREGGRKGRAGMGGGRREQDGGCGAQAGSRCGAWGAAWQRLADSPRAQLRAKQARHAQQARRAQQAVRQPGAHLTKMALVVSLALILPLSPCRAGDGGPRQAGQAGASQSISVLWSALGNARAAPLPLSPFGTCPALPITSLAH